MLIEDTSFNQNAWAPALHLLRPPVAVVEPKQPAEDRDRRRPPRVAPGPAVRLVPSAAPAEAKRGGDGGFLRAARNSVTVVGRSWAWGRRVAEPATAPPAPSPVPRRARG